MKPGQIVGKKSNGSVLLYLGNDENGDPLGQIVDENGRKFNPTPMLSILSRTQWEDVPDGGVNLEQWF